MFLKATRFSLLLLFFSSVAYSQTSEIGILLGYSSYKGELSESMFKTKFWKPAVGVMYKRNLNSHWGYRLGLNYGTITGDDAESDIDYNVNRNLSFRSRVLEFNGMFEFNFFPYQIARPDAKWTPFVFAGLAVYRFNPQAELDDDWIDLQPLGTEGQGTSQYPDREKYKRVAISIPFGGGFKIKFTKRFGITIEAGARRTYTDYLDDVSTTYADKDVLLAENGEIAAFLSDRSIDGQAANNTDRQRGEESNNDWYMFGGITLNFTLSKRYIDNCSPFKGKLR
jgi:hypothetical protein